MSDTTVGTLLDDTATRDAVHFAIAPVVAEHPLSPGQDVGLTIKGTASANVLKAIGIVDPFLRARVMKGDRFWLFLYPNTITSLCHVWTHPAFSEEAKVTVGYDKKDSETWLREFLADQGPSYETLINAVENGGRWSSEDGYSGLVISGDYMTVIGTDANGEIPDEFWNHVENVTGKKMKLRPAYFTCSC